MKLTKYNVGGMEIYSHKKTRVDVKPTWAHVWLLAQTLIVFYAVNISIGMPIQWLVVAVALVWLISAVNKW